MTARELMAAFLKKRGYSDQKIKAEFAELDLRCPASVPETHKELDPKFAAQLSELIEALEDGDPDAWAAAKILQKLAQAQMLKNSKEN